MFFPFLSTKLESLRICKTNSYPLGCFWRTRNYGRSLRSFYLATTRGPITGHNQIVDPSVSKILRLII